MRTHARMDLQTLEMAAHNDTAASLLIAETVFRRAAHMLGSSHELEDVVQTSMIRILEALRNGKIPVRNAEAWVKKIATNVVIDSCRARQAQHADATIELNEETLVMDEMEERYTFVDLDLFEAAFAELHAIHRIILILRFQEGHTYKDISDTLNIPLNTVKSRILRAIEALREIIRSKEDVA